MLKSFLSDVSETPAIGVFRETSTQPSREPVKILIIGSPKAVTNIQHLLYHLSFAEVYEWSPLQPTGNLNEVVSIFIRQISLN